MGEMAAWVMLPYYRGRTDLAEMFDRRRSVSRRQDGGIT